MEILRVEGLKFSYPNQLKKALNNINFSVDEGEFVLICGQSGCGKTTLLRHLKPQLTPHGKTSGSIKYYSKDIMSYEESKVSSEIGYVLQNPDAQIVTDKVWHELAFGLENIGLDTQTIRVRVAEMASFFGIQGWFRKNVSELSGGQKQLLNLAAIMAMQPKILILDEPTSQLDPIASKDFIDTLVRINKELSTTIIIIEHNLEDIYSVSDKVLAMEDSKVVCYDSPAKVIELLVKYNKNNILKGLPTPSKIYNELREYSKTNICPRTVKECKKWIDDNFEKINKKRICNINENLQGDNNKYDVVIELKDVCFKYKKNNDLTLRDVSLKVYKGEIYSILGGNGTGKTTTLSVIARQLKHQRGKILINGKDIKRYNNTTLYEENLALLPQNPQSLFVFETLREDLEEILLIKNKNKDYIDKEVSRVSKMLDIENLLKNHPYDLSGGELQRAALAKIMLLRPKILLLDEPTKGLDFYNKEEIGKILIALKSMGVTVVIVSHDIEFVARYSDRCAMFFDGYIVSEGEPKKFFCGNNFYTTISNRISRDIFEDVLLYEDVVELCKMNMDAKQKVSL
ncbi:MAG: ABC transporter ATP-binding protein [Peptostreptococcaceae bacterium]